MRKLTPDVLESATPHRLGGVKISAVSVSTVDHEAELRAQAQRVFEQAHEQAMAAAETRIASEVSARVEKIEQAMRLEHEAACQALEQARRRMLASADGLQAALAPWSEACELMSVEVAYAAVVRLLGDRAADKSLMASLCHAIVREYGHPPATLRISEEDFVDLDEHLIEIPVEVDRRLRPGQCVIDTARGQLETGLDVRLEGLSKALLQTLAQGR